MVSVYFKRFSYIPLILVFAVFISSCASKQKIKYFQDLPDSGAIAAIKKVPFTEPLIQPDNIITIIIQTLDQSATSAINGGNVPSPAVGANNATNTGQQTTNGYLVDKDGNVALPVLGEIKVAGLTTSQCKELIRSKAAQFYKDPVVAVRLANFNINVLGEVARPGFYVVPNERVTVLDALGLAGDLTIYGKRDNILLLRENTLDNSEEVVRLDLTKSDIIKSPYFYLKPNDKIYVEPSKAKIISSDAAQLRNITIIASALSLLIVLITTLKNK